MGVAEASGKVSSIIRPTILLKITNTEFDIKKKKKSSGKHSSFTTGKGITRLRLRQTGTQRRALEKPL